MSAPPASQPSSSASGSQRWTVPQRQAWMRVLALAPTDALDHAVQSLGATTTLPRTHPLRPPEIGMAMVRARAGGTGERFNLGEMTMTRCALSLETSPAVVGFAHVQGRNVRHAELAALCDGLLQLETWHDAVFAQVIAPLDAAFQLRRGLAARKAAETRVDFFTLVRGES